jgi:beta-carotene 3-hydroxylase
MLGWSLLIWMLMAGIAFIAMEYWARWVHGRVWHGVLYPMHHSHHSPRTWWEWNDILSASHAPISVALILYGCWAEQGVVAWCCFGFGVGMACFGVAYIVVHDGVVHGRLPVQFLRKIPALAAIRRAHRIHHATGTAPYGLFFGPQELEHQSARVPIANVAPVRNPR